MDAAPSHPGIVKKAAKKIMKAGQYGAMKEACDQKDFRYS